MRCVPDRIDQLTGVARLLACAFGIGLAFPQMAYALAAPEPVRGDLVSPALREVRPDMASWRRRETVQDQAERTAIRRSAPRPGSRAASPVAPQGNVRPRVSLNVRSGFGLVTPANGNARLAAMLARSAPAASDMRFTPPTTTIRVNRSVTVAVRARRPVRVTQIEQRAALAEPVTSQRTSNTLVSDLGISIGWQRFALSGSLARLNSGFAGGRKVVDLGLSYQARRWSSRLAVGADLPTGDLMERQREEGAAYSIDLGGSYSLMRDIDLSAGVRYRSMQPYKLGPSEQRQDGEAVYVGTVIRF